jgi:hypothetical protein
MDAARWRGGQAAAERVRVCGAVVVVKAVPRAGDQLDRGPVDLRVLGKEMVGEGKGEVLDDVAEVLLREDMHGVFHRVGGHDVAVVVRGVRGGEIAFERDRGLDFMDRLHGAAVARDPQHADTILAVALRDEPGHHEV